MLFKIIAICSRSFCCDMACALTIAFSQSIPGFSSEEHFDCPDICFCPGSCRGRFGLFGFDVDHERQMVGVASSRCAELKRSVDEALQFWNFTRLLSTFSCSLSVAIESSQCNTFRKSSHGLIVSFCKRGAA